jgi:hypothetical protein
MDMLWCMYSVLRPVWFCFGLCSQLNLTVMFYDVCVMFYGEK